MLKKKEIGVDHNGRSCTLAPGPPGNPGGPAGPVGPWEETIRDSDKCSRSIRPSQPKQKGYLLDVIAEKKFFQWFLSENPPGVFRQLGSLEVQKHY